MEKEWPWTWRLSRGRHQMPWPNIHRHRLSIQDMLRMLRALPSNRYCADCGLQHDPDVMTLREAIPANSIAFANPMLGIFLCKECAKHHREYIPPAFGRCLYIFYDLHEWNLDDIAQVARWGNFRAQKFWLANYKPENKRRAPILRPAASEMSRKEWIHRKYVQREWVADTLVSPYRWLGKTDEEKAVFSTLRRMKWVQPLNPPPRKENNLLLSPSRTSNISPPTATAVPEWLNREAPIDISETVKEAEVKMKERRVISVDYSTLLQDMDGRSDSTYSDDLYGTGRPLRPGLINSDEQIKEWQLSAQGNPEVTIITDQEHTIPSPEFVVTVDAKGTDPASRAKIVELIPSLSSPSPGCEEHQEEDFEVSVTSKRMQSKSEEQDKIISDGPAKISGTVLEDLATLIQPIEATVDSHEECLSLVTTVGEGDASTLAELNEIFVRSMELMDLTQVQAECLSDDATDVDSELDKIEFEFQPVGPLPSREIKVLEEGLETTQNSRSDSSVQDVNHEDIKQAAEKNDTKEFTPRLEIEPPKQANGVKSTPEPQTSVHQAVPFSNIIFGIKRDQKQHATDNKENTSKKEALRDFLLRTGLFGDR